MRTPGLLRQWDFRQLFLADTVSQVGSQVGLLALPLMAVWLLHASSLAVGILSACSTVGFLVVGLPAGAWVDRSRRRRVLICADAGRALILGSVPLAWLFGVLTMGQLYLVALLSSVLTVFFDVAYQSYLPHLVGREHLAEGNARLEGVRAVSQIGGPTLAGLMIQALSAPVAIVIDAVSFVISALFLGRIRKREQLPDKTNTHLGHEVREGLRFVFGSRILRAIALSTASYNFLSAARSAMLTVLLAQVLQLSASVIGAFFSIAAVGSLIGALFARKIAELIGQGPTIWVVVAASAPFQLLVPLAQRGWLLWLSAAAYLVIWLCASVYNITQVSFRQRLTPDTLLGRMNATMRFLVWGISPLGAAVGGVLGQLIGARTTLWVIAVGGVIPLLPLLFSPLRSTRELPDGLLPTERSR
ncbi:MFS transporter [Nocardia arthritidis]|uniref:MFS transporter n=1 Tax=Nocardia arthritidis TaxID=228602 RepID=A0A6G9YHQ3_9NOCA|nr:MFS transporter [Nocardia arthritidis]QIS12779.1 MFS transporter [Nocardia arthritidis]